MVLCDELGMRKCCKITQEQGFYTSHLFTALGEYHCLCTKSCRKLFLVSEGTAQTPIIFLNEKNLWMCVRKKRGYQTSVAHSLSLPKVDLKWKMSFQLLLKTFTVMLCPYLTIVAKNYIFEQLYF